MKPADVADARANLLALPDWHARAVRHHSVTSPYAKGFVARRGYRVKHPVHDFLFTYYSFSPTKLTQWWPGLGVAIEAGENDAAEFPWLCGERCRFDGDARQLDESRLEDKTRDLARWIEQLCGAIMNRPARFRCFGLHEWAMVYQLPADKIRHQGWNLRLDARELADFVESQSLCCSHYDAYRFFTPESKPLNTLRPVLEKRLEMEQAGCVHANMDLYKWATKLWPWIGSDLILDTFLLALECRELDMRASPYDLDDLGFRAIAIETPEGREAYEQAQRALTAKAEPIRKALLEQARRIAEWA